MPDHEWKLPSLTPRDVVRWGTAVFILCVYALLVTMFILALFGVFP